MSPKSSNQLFPARAARFGADTDPDAFRFCDATGRINSCCVRLITVGLGSTGASSASDAPTASRALSSAAWMTHAATCAPRLPRETRRLSDGRVDGVEATWSL